MNDIKTLQRVKFIEAGYDCIPLYPASKKPLRKSWQKRPTFTQWHDAPTNSNLGLRAGNGKAFIDCDDKNQPGTFENVAHWMDGLGYDRESLPVVQTPTDNGIGRHVYVTFTGSLLGSRRNFVSTVGAGDFRYGAASFVATFPDIVEGVGEYKLLQGDITRLPVLDLKDIATLVDVNKAMNDSKQDKHPSRLALAIMSGIKPERYQSKSEGEAGLVLSLVNSGYEYHEIKCIFESNPCLGHYAEKHKAKSLQEAERWLYMTFENMRAQPPKEGKVRRLIAEWMERANGAPWQRVTDKNLFLGHLNIAYKPGRLEYSADVRTLSLESGVGTATVSRGNKRLAGIGLLSVVNPGKGLSATTFALNCAKMEHFLKALNVRKCSKMAQHDAFMNGKNRLGRRAGEVYELLLSEALTFDEIHERTKIPPRTLWRILGKLQSLKDRKTGEIIEMVSKREEGMYAANLVDLDLVSAIMGTYGATGKRRDEYERDRRNHARSLELGAIKNL